MNELLNYFQGLPLKACQPTIYIPISGHIIYARSIITLSMKITFIKIMLLL